MDRRQGGGVDNGINKLYNRRMNKKLVSLRVDADVWRRLKANAALAGVTIADYIAALMKAA